MSTDTDPWELTRPSAEHDLEHEFDRLSLTQALIDFEVANARVVDLTQRLLSATDELVAVRRELEDLRKAHDEVRTERDQVRNSRAFKLASRIWSVRNLL